MKYKDLVVKVSSVCCLPAMLYHTQRAPRCVFMTMSFLEPARSICYFQPEGLLEHLLCSRSLQPDGTWVVSKKE